MNKEDIVNYFRHQECDTCPFSVNCDVIMDCYDAPSICNIIEGNIEGMR